MQNSFDASPILVSLQPSLLFQHVQIRLIFYPYHKYLNVKYIRYNHYCLYHPIYTPYTNLNVPHNNLYTFIFFDGIIKNNNS